MTKRAVVLISGGLDSCTTAFIAKKEGYEIYALSFNYGQRHNKEIECAKKVASGVNAKKHVVFDLDLSQFGGSSLLSDSSEIPETNALEDIGKEIPSTYVPARNTVFLSIALAFAETVDADAIFIGVTAADYSGYPDCRPKYIEAFQKMANLATKKGVEGKSVEIMTPLLHMTKSMIIKKGLSLGAPFEKTWSCYKGSTKACGKCDSCQLRLKGFNEIEKHDPISYEFYPKWYKKN